MACEVHWKLVCGPAMPLPMYRLLQATCSPTSPTQHRSCSTLALRYQQGPRPQGHARHPTVIGASVVSTCPLGCSRALDQGLGLIHSQCPDISKPFMTAPQHSPLQMHLSPQPTIHSASPLPLPHHTLSHNGTQTSYSGVLGRVASGT